MQRTVRRLGWCLTLATSVVAGITCESPTAPRGVGQRIAIGATISGKAAPNDAQRYSVLIQQDGEYAVFLAASFGTAQLAVLDSQHLQLLAQLNAGPTSGPLLSNATPDFSATKGTVLLITVGAQTGVGFDFQVYAVNPAPERRAAAFSIGDTVTGEDIDPVADVDNFWMQGQAGQEIVVVPQPLGRTGAGTLILFITDTLLHSEAGYAFNDPGSASPRTTARIRLHSSAAYRFQLRGVAGVNSNVAPRYQGPYRFWSYAINRAPEHRSPVLPVGAEVSGERIDRAGDVDEFTFQAAVGAQYNAFAQGSRQVQLEVAPDSGPALAAMVSDTADTGLYAAATGRFTIPHGGGYLVRVSGTASYDQADTGSYRVLLYPIDPRPEHVPATIQPGDTISGESIDVPGDIDDFPFPGVAGDEFNVFFQVLTGFTVPLQLTVADSSGLAVGLVQSRGADTSLTGQFTGRFTLPSGPERIHVEGTGTNTGLDTGAYRFRVVRINRAPETLAGTLVFGDSLFGERIDLPGDVDEFHVSIPDSSGANLVAAIDSGGIIGLLSVALLDSSGHTVLAPQLSSPGTIGVSGTTQLAPGNYTLRVQGLDNTSAFVGPYRVWLYKIGFGPEVAPDTIPIGDTITTERLDQPGDVDRFRFFGRQGDHINIALSGATSSAQGGFFASLTGPPEGSYASVGAPSLADSLGAHQTNRVDLSVTGWYTISVWGANNLTAADTGHYRLALTRVGTAPEHAAAAIVPGDSVTNEAMDFPEDWDEFTLTAPPGQVLDVVATGAIDPYSPLLNVFDSSTGASLAGLLVRSWLTASGRFTVPASGQLELSVGYPRGSTNFCFDTCSFGSAGPYRFTVLAVNPQPEGVPATFVVGDTVKGEAIYPAGDLDEFTASATPGDTLAPWWRLTADAVPAGESINLRVIDPTTGSVLIGDNISQVVGSPAFISPGQFVVPASGQFLVQVRAYSDNSPGTAPYEFFVAPVP